MRSERNRRRKCLALTLPVVLCVFFGPGGVIGHPATNSEPSHLLAKFDPSRVQQSLAPPANDNWANATVIIDNNGVLTGLTNVQATKETGEPNHAGNAGGHSIWFRWVSPAYVESVRFAAYTLQPSIFDPLLAVYTGTSVSSLTLVSSNDDFGDSISSRATFLAAANSVYYIAVDGRNGSAGPMEFDWQMSLINLHGSQFDGSASDNIAVFRPSNGNWYADAESNFVSVHFGTAGDVPVPKDYDGDGFTDYAIFRPSNGTWYLLLSAHGTVATVPWGLAGDKPVPGDYFADGRADLAVFRPSNGFWYIEDPFNGQTIFRAFGLNGDIPVQLDYDGDGRYDTAVFRPSSGYWYIWNSHDNSFRAQQWGQNGDIPVPGDYVPLPDGRADLAVFRPSVGNWYVLSSRDNSYTFTKWGQNGDIPQPRSYGAGTGTTFCVFRPSTSTWYTIANVGGGIQTMQFGAPGDIPVTAGYVVGP